MRKQNQRGKSWDTDYNRLLFFSLSPSLFCLLCNFPDDNTANLKTLHLHSRAEKEGMSEIMSWGLKDVSLDSHFFGCKLTAHRLVTSKSCWKILHTIPYGILYFYKNLFFIICHTIKYQPTFFDHQRLTLLLETVLQHKSSLLWTFIQCCWRKLQNSWFLFLLQCMNQQNS